MYQVLLKKSAVKDLSKLKQSGLLKKAKTLLELLEQSPWVIPPSYEKLVGDWSGAYSRRINKQHRLIYEVDEENKVITVYSLWSHYE